MSKLTLSSLFKEPVCIKHKPEQKCYPRFLEVLRMLSLFASNRGSNNNIDLRKQIGIDIRYTVVNARHSNYLNHHFTYDQYEVSDTVTITPYQFLTRYKDQIQYLELKEKYGESLR